jgi:hypothetical protein
MAQVIVRVEDSRINALVEDSAISLVIADAGPQGPQGPQGPSGDISVYVQDLEPTPEAGIIWIQTGLGSGEDFTVWFYEDD